MCDGMPLRCSWWAGEKPRCLAKEGSMTWPSRSGHIYPSMARPTVGKQETRVELIKRKTACIIMIPNVDVLSIQTRYARCSLAFLSSEQDNDK